MIEESLKMGVMFILILLILTSLHYLNQTRHKTSIETLCVEMNATITKTGCIYIREKSFEEIEKYCDAKNTCYRISSPIFERKQKPIIEKFERKPNQ